MQQCILQRAAPVPGRRMHHKTGGFIDDQQRLIFINDIQSDSFRLTINNDLGFCIQGDRFTAFDAILGFGRPDLIQLCSLLREYSGNSSASA